MRKKTTKYVKAAQGLGVFQNAQKITNVVKDVVTKKYPITECLYLLKNMWTKPTYTDLCISSYAWYKLTAFINLVGDYEISGFGRIQKVKYLDQDGQECWLDTITDVDIIKQEVKSAYVESDADAVLEFIMKLPADQRNEWTLDWHSHVNMGTSPSSTDWNNYSEMLKARMGKQFPIMIVNKKGDATSYQIMSESRHESINIKVVADELPEHEIVSLYNECKEKVETLCTRPAVTTTAKTTTTKTWNGRWANQGYDYEYDYYGYGVTDKGKHWWEDEEEDEEVAKAKAQGFVFDDDKEDYSMLCAECGKPLNPQNLEEINMGVCSECFNEALRQ